MSAEKDITLDEKRVYGAKRERSELFVATGTGLLRVAVSGALVGEFGLVHRGAVNDVAAGGTLAVATDEDVLLGRADGEDVRFEPTGFGPATAVSAREGVVASDGDRVAELGTEGWVERSRVEGVTALDGRLVAAESGVHRLDGTHIGLEGVLDVDTRGTPLAATDDGLYYLGNGWIKGADGRFEAVSAGDTDDSERAHAVGPEGLYAMAGGPGEWTPLDLPVASLVDVTHGETTYAVAGDGTLLADDPAEDAWRERTLGLPDARALAVVEPGGQ